MAKATKALISAWVTFACGISYALFVPVGEASAWVLLPTALLGLPLLGHFAVVALRPVRFESDVATPKVIVDGVEYVPKTSHEQ